MSPDGERVAVVLEDGRVRVWDWEAGKVLNDPVAAGEAIETLARFSGDSAKLIVGALSEDDMAKIHPNYQAGRTHTKHARIINASTGAELARLPLDRPISNAAISQDGTLAVTADRLGLVVLWNTADGTVVSELGALGTKIIDLTFFGDDRGIRAVSKDGVVQIWSKQSYGSPTTRPSQADAGSSSSCSQEIKYSIKPVVSRDAFVIVTDAATSQQVAKLGGTHQGFVKETHSTPDGKRIVSIDGTGVIRLWDPSSGKLLSELNVKAAVGYFEPASFLGFTNDCRLLLTHDSSIKLWSAETGVLVRELGPSKGNEVGADLHRNGDWLALVRRSDEDIRAEGYEVEILSIKDEFKLRLPSRFSRRPRLRFASNDNLIVSTPGKGNLEFFVSSGVDGAVQRGKHLADRCMLASVLVRRYVPLSGSAIR